MDTIGEFKVVGIPSIFLAPAPVKITIFYCTYGIQTVID